MSYGLLTMAVETLLLCLEYVICLVIIVAALIGMIPNCAASVLVTRLYIDGILSTGGMLAGLLTGAGVGLLVLFRLNRRPKENLLITLGLYALGVGWGLLFDLLGVVF